MLKQNAYALLIGAALIASPVLAQNSPPPATNVAPVTTPAGPAGSTMGANPNATAGANATMSANTNAGGSNQFMTRREPGMFRASELIGKDVRGANNEDIGEVGDVLIDRSGQVRAVIVDIGGFLGIGETHVAVPMQSLQFRSNQQNAGAMGASNNNASALPNTTGATGAANQNQANRAANAQNQANTSTGANQGAASNQAAGSNEGGPDLIVLVMTKEQLQRAPKFEDDNRGARRSNAPAGANTNTGATGAGTGTAPRQ